MAKPIAPTPVLKGQAAIDFISELSKDKKLSEAENVRIKQGFDRIKSMLTFNI